MFCFTTEITGTIYPNVFSPKAQLTPHQGQVVPQDHFFPKSYISETIYFRSKIIVLRDAPHPEIYVHS